MGIIQGGSIHREKNLCAGAASPICVMALAALVLNLAGCGANINLATAASTGQVQTYYSGSIGSYSSGQLTMDHYGKQLSFDQSYTSQIAPALRGSFTTTAEGVTNITETAGPGMTAGTTIVTMPTPVTGAWLTEIPGVAATGNLLYTLNGTVWRGSAALMAANTECPNFPTATRFLFVTTPPQSLYAEASNYYGTTDITTQGASVDFNTNYYTLGQPLSNPIAYQGDAACATTALGSLISYPVNQVSGGSYGYAVIAKSQFLYGVIPAVPHSCGFVYGVKNAVGMAMPSSAVNTSALASTHFIGMLDNPLLSPMWGAAITYDPGVLSGAFGDVAGSSATCSSFQAKIASSLTSGAISAAPSAAAIYGGEFPQTLTNATGAPGASGAETCDMAIDLGAQDAANHGLFPSAQLYVGGTSTVTSEAGAAIVSQLEGRTVILLRTNSTSSTTGRLLVLFQALQ